MKTKSQNTEILQELGSLLYFCYNGTDSNIATPSPGDYVDVLDGLRGLKILIKYLQFDLEATRRENVHLIGLLERRQ